MPAVVNAMKEEATLVTLVKPQFEARRSQVRSLMYACKHIYTLAFRIVFLPAWMLRIEDAPKRL